MQIPAPRSSLAAAAMLAVLAPAQDAPAQPDPAEYDFRGPGLRLDGVAKLSDLRGRPVLIDFWGRR